MRVSELITNLKQGELKKLFVKSSDADVLSFVNAGILNLYEKFPLRRDNIAVTPVVGVKDYSFGDYDANVDFDPDENQLILIETVTAIDPNGNEDIFIPSNSTRPQNFSTPVYNVLRIHPDYETYTLEVEVRLAPPALTKINEDIPLPPQLLGLLSLYVGYKAHSSVSVDLKGENNSYYIRYNSEVREMLANGQYPLDSLDYSMLHSRGFI